jgi:TrmH family RNA methyltransferase
MDITVVVVEPHYQINLGYIARIAKNFSAGSLVLVNPKCRYNGKNARKYAKHGVDLLDSARVCGSNREAVGSSFSLGTTGLWRKGKSSLYNIYSLEEMSAMLKANRIESFSIVLGRESTGLTKEELRECSSIIYIPIEGGYKILNISHALAILMYELEKSSTVQRKPVHIYANDAELSNTIMLFDAMISRRSDIRSKRTVSMAMEHILMRAHPTKKELSALSVALAKKRMK